MPTKGRKRLFGFVFCTRAGAALAAGASRGSSPNDGGRECRNFAIALVAALAAPSPSALAAKAHSEEALCKVATTKLGELRYKQDTEQGYTEVFVAQTSFYNASTNKCFATMIEVYRQDGFRWLRRSIIDPISRKLYALFRSNTEETDKSCEFLIDGVRAQCIDFGRFRQACQREPRN